MPGGECRGGWTSRGGGHRSPPPGTVRGSGLGAPRPCPASPTPPCPSAEPGGSGSRSLQPMRGIGEGGDRRGMLMTLPEPGALTRCGKARVSSLPPEESLCLQGFLSCGVLPPFHTPGIGVQRRGETERKAARSLRMRFPGCAAGSLRTGRPHGRLRCVGAGVPQHPGGLLPTPPPPGVGDFFERRRTLKRGATFRSRNFPLPAIPLPNFKRFMDVSTKGLPGIPGICLFISAPHISSHPKHILRARGVSNTREKSLCLLTFGGRGA